MDVNVMRQRCRVIRTASNDVFTLTGFPPVPWERFGWTAGDIITFTQWGEGDRRFKDSIGWFESWDGKTSAVILHGEAEVLKV